MTNFPSWTKNCQNELAYFLGLITGRGTFEPSKKIIIIEFAYAKPLEGIPFCPKCNHIMKGEKVKKCKTHGKQKIKYNVGPYDQQEEIEEYLKKVFRPILKKITKNQMEIGRSKTKSGGMTIFHIQFTNEAEKFDWIWKQFKPNQNFNDFEIPKDVCSWSEKLQREYVSGVTDTAGFPKWANFDRAEVHPTTSGKKYDRARMYFQFVRNWKLPVQFCYLLQTNLKIPVDSIRWGHPNIDDGSRADYDENEYTAMREHQLKIFAENFQPKFHKLKYKRKILQELYDYNKDKKFLKNNSCKPPKSIRVSVDHPGEKDSRLPKALNQEHFDAYWQICWKMGCKLCDNIVNKNYAYQTGRDEVSKKVIKNIEQDLKNRREKKYQNAVQRRKITNKKVKNTGTARKKQGLKEQDTYVPLKKWLQKQLKKNNTNKSIISEIVADTTINRITSIQHIPEIVTLVQDLAIRPDVIGFVDDQKMTFIESKITSINLANVGQLLAYCMIADPDKAYLISTKSVSSTLIKIIKAYPDLISYNGKKIEVGTLDMKTEMIRMQKV